MENRRKRWYDLFGLLPRNLGRLLLWFSLIPIAFIIVLLVYAWRADQYELDEVLAPLENCAAYDRNGQWIGTLTDHDRQEYFFLILGGGYVRFRRFIHVSGCDNNAYRS